MANQYRIGVQEELNEDLLRVSSIVENAPYHLRKGSKEMAYVGNSQTCTCSSSNSGSPCRATSSLLEESV